MTANEKFLTQRQRYQPVTLPQDFSDEEIGNAIDAWADIENAKIMRKSSQDLLAMYRDLNSKWKAELAVAEEKKREFLRLCDIIRTNCLTGSQSIP